MAPKRNLIDTVADEAPGDNARLQPPTGQCQRITDDSSDTAYYLTADIREEKEGGEEVLDLNVTDLKNAWCLTGHHRPTKGLTREHWMTFAREAFLGETVPRAPSGERQLHWSVTPGQPDMDSLTVMWTFMADLGAGERRWKAEVIAHKAADSRSIAEPMVHGLLKELHSAQSTCARLRVVSEGLAAEVDTVQSSLMGRLAVREASEEQLYVKFAALLNEGKQLTAEYRDRARNAEERLERLCRKGGRAAHSERSVTASPTRQGAHESDAASVSTATATASISTDAGSSGSQRQPSVELSEFHKDKKPSSAPPLDSRTSARDIAHRQSQLDELELVETPNKRVAARRKKRPPQEGGTVAHVGDFSQL